MTTRRKFLALAVVTALYGGCAMSQSPKSRMAVAAARVRAAIQAAEGFDCGVYPDPGGKGKLAVGWGHLVKPGDNLKTGNRITRERAELLFQADIAIAVQAVNDQHRERLASLSAPRSAVLIEMAYVLGPTGLQGFAEMPRAVSEENWTLAGAEIKDSDWWGDAPVHLPGIQKRILRLQTQTASGRWR